MIARSKRNSRRDSIRTKRHRLALRLALVFTGLTCYGVNAQLDLEPTRLIDSPTAGLIDKGRFAVDLRLFPDGGVLTQINAGVMRRLSIGLSYGGVNVIGDDLIDWHPRVEVAARYRVIEETTGLPAITAGYETQGFGPYQRTSARYKIKSKGFFVAGSKNYISGLGQFGVHGGINWSRERDDGDKDVSGWAGIDKTINEELAVVAEYDFAFNDNDSSSLGEGKGYLNAGVHWSAVPNISVGFVLKNVLGNGDDNGGGPDSDLSRELSVRYSEAF
jgi:hypothetical protein